MTLADTAHQMIDRSRLVDASEQVKVVTTKMAALRAEHQALLGAHAAKISTGTGSSIGTNRI